MPSGGGVRETILVADNEPDILRFVEVNLRLEGFDVTTARDGEEVLRLASETRPSLILLDVMMPKLDGLEVCRRLRADARTSHVPIIILTAKSLTVDKVLGLTAGADDYVLKPFDPTELVARVRTTLRRAGDLRASSPLTGLPGNHRIQLEVARRLSEGLPTAAVYADLNDFKPYNDCYGFVRGDGVILMTSDVLQAALDRHASPDAFVGHVGGDDFMLICAPEEVDAVCQYVIAEFDRRIPEHYDPEDLERRYLEMPNRQGDLQRYPIVSIAMGVATTARRPFTDHRAMIEVANEMKAFLKQQPSHSTYAIDERQNGGEAAGDGWVAGKGAGDKTAGGKTG
jgi:diguanylate cyclase (GGDEF)-like protein